jgi:AAA15 family ATPase/GTPase
MSKTITRHIKNLYLDPNNYRFIDNHDYKKVDDYEIKSQRVQQRTFNLLAGKNFENISDLIKSFKANRILKDSIQVKELKDGGLLVVEGNRRTAALKKLYRDFIESKDVGKLKESDFKSLEVVLITDENPVEHLITMGIHHISGKRKWSPINQAQLIKDLLEVHQLSESEICESLAITKHNLRRNLRTLALIDRYKESDFGDQFESSMYSVFEETIKNTKMKAWLNWNDDEMKPLKHLNEERLFHWISKEETTEYNKLEEEVEVVKEPIITKSHEIRELSKFIEDPNAVDQMEESRSISQAYALSDAVGEARLHSSLENISKEVNTAFKFSEYLKSDEYNLIGKLKTKLDNLIPSTNSNAVISGSSKPEHFFQEINSHFSEIKINSYKRLNCTKLNKVGKVNIFAGGNNTGKTSLLEAIYLQSNLNDISVLVDLERVRGNFGSDISSKWIDEMFYKSISIDSVFNKKKCSLRVDFKETSERINKSNYIKTIQNHSTVQNESFKSRMHLYGDRYPTLLYEKLKKLCNSVISSPFRYTPNLLEKAHAKSIENQYLTIILDFINKYIDSSIEKIELINIDGVSRFMVSSNGIVNSLDLSQYGEGVQRVFEIGLFMGYCKNGVFCIDEIDSAIHKDLLIPFTAFIQSLADKFNVQVFLSTHSKECIDAFVLNDYSDDDLMAYALTEENGEINSKFLEGNELKSLVDSINIDIR